MILAATGLRREAHAIASPEVRAVIGGGRAASLEAALAEAAPGAEAIISIGLAGALAEELRVADWVVADSVVWDGGQAPTDARWSEALRSRLAGASMGRVLGSDAPLADRQAKAQARARFGALAVDMESHVAARAAAQLGLPFAAARVISDAADETLPKAAVAGMGPTGEMRPLRVLRELLGAPSELGPLLRTAVTAERAFLALARGRRRLGVRLGLP